MKHLFYKCHFAKGKCLNVTSIYILYEEKLYYNHYYTVAVNKTLNRFQNTLKNIKILLIWRSKSMLQVRSKQRCKSSGRLHCVVQ